VQRVGGFVAKYMGDGVLVFFGYPQAHEDDAERAVRGGLALIEAVGKLDSAEPRQGRPSGPLFLASLLDRSGIARA
jgi:class 3 adenylate cyclase